LLDWPEIALRLGVATLAGCLIGLNRDLQGKPIGLKTLGLVGLATAMIVTVANSFADPAKSPDAASRVMQGILTGIGFLGAGVIVHSQHHFRVRGLTSAACTWLAACIGIACGVGQWPVVAVTLAIAFALLIVGRRLERWLHRMLGGQVDQTDQEDRTQKRSASASPDSEPG
jgi:putative Mg2+ transporter-C (MgtC) family protein